MGRADFDCLDDFLQIHTIPFGEQRPLVHERKDGGTVAVLDDFCGFGLDGPFQHRERIVLCVEHFAKEPRHPFARGLIDTAAHAPEVTNGGDVILAWHHAFVAVGQERFGFDAAPFENLLHDRIGDLFGGARSDCRFNQHERRRRDVFGNSGQRRFERGHLCRSGPHVAEGFLQVVTLHVHHDDVGQFQSLLRVGRHHGLFVFHTALDQSVHFRVLGLDG